MINGCREPLVPISPWPRHLSCDAGLGRMVPHGNPEKQTEGLHRRDDWRERGREQSNYFYIFELCSSYFSLLSAKFPLWYVYLLGDTYFFWFSPSCNPTYLSKELHTFWVSTCLSELMISLLCVLITAVSVYAIHPSFQHLPGLTGQSWDIQQVSMEPPWGYHVPVTAGIYHWQQLEDSKLSWRFPCHQVPPETCLVLLPLGGLSMA